MWRLRFPVVLNDFPQSATEGAEHRLDGAMNTHMPGQVARRTKSFATATGAASMRSLASVSLHVLIERVLAVESTSTLEIRALESSAAVVVPGRLIGSVRWNVLHGMYFGGGG
ncbi:hypothetical protein PsorP6_005589 [Peronosclerospora sorghi]|uniref:Uncharacterized protein n=1 Tax=Peronosclerospora sorghi TaxID=230839 RepID=A0ACC0W3C6_9STRA|nr:hypothetical protein PsorP6_005589 [Peronosclerospora sorghi]